MSLFYRDKHIREFYKIKMQKIRLYKYIKNFEITMFLHNIKWVTLVLKIIKKKIIIIFLLIAILSTILFFIAVSFLNLFIINKSLRSATQRERGFDFKFWFYNFLDF